MVQIKLTHILITCFSGIITLLVYFLKIKKDRRCKMWEQINKKMGIQEFKDYSEIVNNRFLNIKEDNKSDITEIKADVKTLNKLMTDFLLKEK